MPSPYLLCGNTLCLLMLLLVWFVLCFNDVESHIIIIFIKIYSLNYIFLLSLFGLYQGPMRKKLPESSILVSNLLFILRNLLNMHDLLISHGKELQSCIHKLHILAQPLHMDKVMYNFEFLKYLGYFLFLVYSILRIKFYS